MILSSPPVAASRGRRARLLLLAVPALAACGSLSPIPERPKLAIEAIGALMEPAGTASMQTPSVFGPVNQPEVGLAEGLNLADREFGYGGNLSYGDDFAGVEIGFFSWKHGNVTTKGELEYGFGNLQQGDEVQTAADWDLYRLALRVPVFEHELQLKDGTPIDLRFAAGLAVHHTEFRMRSEAVGADREQTIKVKDDYGIPFATVRFETELKPFKLRFDLSGTAGDYGDVDGTVLDAQITLHYRIQRGVSVSAGYWLYQLPGQGEKDGLNYELDLELSGYMVGLRWEF